ncbi:MAG: hypothetical protein ACFE8M_02830 [Candidatus Hermodarchaeota archaeon]
MKIKSTFRKLFVIGLVLALISLFLDWYIFQAFNIEGEQVVYWSYSPLFDWYSPIFASGSVFNELYKPQNSAIPFAMTILFIISVFLSIFGVLFKDIEKDHLFQKLRFYAYIHIFTVLFTAFYIFIYPIWYLLPNNLYFPFVEQNDPFLEVQFLYSVHIGYIIQIIGFILLFPYTIFYYHTLNLFEKESQSPENVVKRYLKKIQEPLDFDKYIREEELKLDKQKKDYKW